MQRGEEPVIEIWARAVFNGKQYQLVAAVQEVAWSFPEIRESKRHEMKAKLAQAIADDLEIEYRTVSVDGPFRSVID